MDKTFGSSCGLCYYLTQTLRPDEDITRNEGQWQFLFGRHEHRKMPQGNFPQLINKKGAAARAVRRRSKAEQQEED
jgi:hypothetical protein